MSDEEKVIVELTKEEYGILRDMLQGQRAVRWLHAKAKVVAISVTVLVGAYFALAEFLAKVFQQSLK